MFTFDLLFEVQVPRPWKEGKEKARFNEAVEQVLLAEQLGFGTAWFVEHHFLTEFAHSSAPEVVLGALSQRTSKIRLGHGVTLLPKAVNHPIRVAERAAMIDIMSDGRLEMGTGRSSSPYQLEAFGTDIATTREQWEESVKLLPQLWTQENFSYHGQFYSWDDKITVVPRPLQRPHPPLWVASTQTDTCKLAGEKGVGLLLPAVRAPSELKSQIDIYREAVADPVDPAGHFVNNQAALFALAFVHDDDDKARVVGGSAAMWYVETITQIYANDWRGTPLEQIPDSYRAHAEARRRGAAAAGTISVGDGSGGSDVFPLEATKADRQAMINQFIESGAFCVGDPARVVENVKKYIDAGADRLICVMQLGDLLHEDVMRSVELLGTTVMPEIRAYEESRVAGTTSSMPVG